MTDEQMFAMDDAIAGAFKSMGKAQREEKAKIELQKMNFKVVVATNVFEFFMQTEKDFFGITMNFQKQS